MWVTKHKFGESSQTDPLLFFTSRLKKQILLHLSVNSSGLQQGTHSGVIGADVLLLNQ